MTGPGTLHLSGAAGTPRVTPDSVGWQWCGLSVADLQPGETAEVVTGDAEVFVLPLAGGLTVEVAGPDGQVDGRFALDGRDSVFSRVSDFAYAGRDSVLRLRSDQHARVAIPSARCSRRLPPAYGPASAVPVEIRGAGPATRQVNNFGTPGAWGHAEKLMACELLTPPGNWSSYPPHKHDVTRPCTAVDEEIYYYRVAGADQVTPGREGFGLHRTYTGPEHEQAGLAPVDTLAEVRDGDVVLVPYGYHGPCVAAPGYPLYYLNVLAGPGGQRSMDFCDDPAHGWVRGSWEGLPADPRCPVTSAAGRVQARADAAPGSTGRQ